MISRPSDQLQGRSHLVLRDKNWQVLSQSTQDRLRCHSLQVVPVAHSPSVEVEDATSRSGKKKLTMKRYQIPGFLHQALLAFQGQPFAGDTFEEVGQGKTLRDMEG